MDRFFDERMMNCRIAVAIPCYDEAKTIAKVIADFQKQLPHADIYVIDNNSKDNSAELARQAGAKILFEKRQGKGFVVSSIMRRIEADIYVMVDGDDTYPAEKVHELLRPILDEEADMVVGRRLQSYDNDAFRPLHMFGNRLVCWLINTIFKAKLTDPMSGFRAFTAEVAYHLPLIASGFDVETEMTIQMLYRHFIIHEVDIHYRERASDNPSKLNTFRDGLLVLMKILRLMMTYKPLTFFGLLAIFTMILAGFFGYFPIREYYLDQYVYSVPRAILAASLVTLSGLLFGIGITLTSINLRLLEISSQLRNFGGRDEKGSRTNNGIET